MRDAYDRGGAKEVFRGALGSGPGKLVDIIGISPNETNILRSKEILDETA